MKLSCTLKLSVAVFAAAMIPFCASAKITVTVSHTHVESHPDHIGFEAFKDHIEKNIGDKFEIQIYPNAVLGSNDRVFGLVKTNSVQFMAISSSNIENFDSLYSLFSIPYLFTSRNAYESFISDPKVIESLGANAKTDGFRPLGAFTAGIRNFYAKFPINTVDDLKGKTFRVQSGKTNADMIAAFGATDYLIRFNDVYSALKQGVVDGAENNELALVDQKHGEICKYYCYDGHQMVPDMIIGSEEFLSKLSPEELKIFQDAAIEAQKVEFAAWENSINKAIEEAKIAGVTFTNVNVNEFRDKVLPMHKSILKEHPDIKSLYDKAVEYNTKYN